MHSRPITDVHKSTLNDFLEYLKSKTRIQSDDDIIFLEVFKEGDIINLFKEELVKQHYLLKSYNYSNKIDNNDFDFIKY